MNRSKSRSTSRFTRMAVVLSLVAAIATGWAGPAGAVTYTWDNSNVTGSPVSPLDWFTGGTALGLWTGPDVPVSDNTNTIQFFADTSTALTNTDTPSVQTSNINNGGAAFELGALTLSGLASGTTGANLTMTISGDTSNDALNFSAATGTINLDGLNATQTLTYNLNSNIQLGTAGSAGALTITGNGTGTFNIGGVISELQTGGGSLIKSGSSTVTLSGANTYTGATTLSAGTLNLSNQNAVQNSTLTMGGGSLVFDSSVLSNAFTFGGLAASAAGAGYDIALQNNAETPAAVALTVGGNDASTTYAAVLSGAGSLTKAGTGTLTLSGANNYTGATNITEGTLTISNAATFTNTSAINLSGTGRLMVSAANSSLAKLSTSGGGTGVVAGTFLRYSLAQNAAGASNGPGTIFGTVELDLTNVNPNYTLDFGAGSILTNTKGTTYNSPITLSGNATINATSGGFTGGTSMTVGSTTGGAKTLTLTGTQTSSITGAISDGSGGGTIGLTKSGTGVWRLSGANTYTGPTNNTQHVLQYDNFSAIGNTSKITTTSSGTIYFNNGILGGKTITTPMELSGAYSYKFAGGTTGKGALIIWAGGVVTFNNAITLLASSAIHLFSGGLTANFNGTITGTGDMTFNIGGAARSHNVYVVLNSGSSLTYSGNTIVTTFGNGNATVKLNGGYLPSTLLHLKDNYYSSTFNNTAVFDLYGHNQTLSGLTDTAEAGGGGRFVVNTSGTQSILTIDGTTNQTFAGVIGVNNVAGTHGQTPGDGNIALVKAGSGTQTLTGINTYTGDTIIEAGTLSITHAYLADAADVYLTTGATFNLNFTGIADVIDELFFDGTAQDAGTWGALGSAAEHKNAFFTGGGLLLVTTSGIVPGDTNGDKVVDAFDFITLKKNFNKPGAGVEQGNFNSDVDGFVDWADLSILMNAMSPGGSGAPPVPEPATLGLLAIGALAMLRRNRRS